MNGALPTDGLRGLHLPADPGLWPPGPAWWISALLLAVLVAITVVWIARWRAARRWQVAALAECTAIEKAELNTPDQCGDVVRACSRLLRRVALALRPPANVAGLTGEQWLRQLDNIGQTSAFSAGVGRLLVEGPYKPDAPQLSEVKQLLELTRSTISRAKLVPQPEGQAGD